MIHKAVSTTIAASLALGICLTASTGFAERKKFELLKPADGPCLYFLDDEGNDTSTIANAPCDANGTIVNPGDPRTIPANANAVKNRATPATTRGERDAASGMATGKR
jgi:hypothetical protein